MTPRLVTGLLSLAAHAAVAFALLHTASHATDEGGTGEEMFRVEQGIAIESLTKLGEEVVATPAVDTETVEASEVRPELDEVKASDAIEEQAVIASREGPVQEIAEVEPVKVPQPAQIATAALPEATVVELQSSGPAKSAGDPTIRARHLGALYRHLEGRKVRPRSRDKGMVVVRLTLDAKGAVVSRTVATGSGSQALDDAALASIDRAAPFPAMPEGFGTDSITVSVPFRYR